MALWIFFKFCSLEISHAVTLTPNFNQYSKKIANWKRHPRNIWGQFSIPKQDLKPSHMYV